MEKKFSSYEWWDKAGTTIGVFFSLLIFIFAMGRENVNYTGIWVSSFFVVIGLGIVFYNDYKHEYYDRIKERLLSVLLLIVLTLFYWFYQA